MNLKRMGVLNVTPNSFSDGGEFFFHESLKTRINFLKNFDFIDIGAESTAPMNQSLSWEEEWERWQMVLPLLKDIGCSISADTYHPETIFSLVKHWSDHKLKSALLWNDISGKYDDAVREFLKTGKDYIFCHNLAPSRELSGRHMDYVQKEINLTEYFLPFKQKQIIFDPCFGFSKNYEQNWEIIHNFQALQKAIDHSRWLIGFSRKSFLRKKHSTDNRDDLDKIYVEEIEKMKATLTGEIWVRTHRPELLED